MVLTVVQDIVPFLVLTSIVLLGFTLALALVTKGKDVDNFNRHGILSAFSTTIDMGLYATTIDPATMHEPLILSFYFPFMLIVQVILLNLIIAIMSDSTQRNIRGAAMVARYQRARLIVDLEPRSNMSAAKALQEARHGYFGVATAWLSGLLAFGISEDPRPRWLHVLMPPDGQEEDEGFDLETQLTAMRRAVSSLHTELQQMRNDLPPAVERQLRLASAGAAAPPGS